MNELIQTRFDGSIDIEKIREHVTVRPDAVEGLRTVHPSIASEALAEALKQIYLPNAFSLNFISEMAARASLHSQKLFRSETEYISKVYDPPEVEVSPICLTGLAGIGKSQTITALRKVLPPPVDFSCDHYQGTIELISHWYH